MSRTSGNSDDESYVGSGELRARTAANRVTLRGEKNFERSDGEKTEDETLVRLNTIIFSRINGLCFVSTSFEEDEIELLNLRTAVAAGVGYQFFEREELFLSVEAGPAYVNEDFEEDDDEESLSIRWGIDYEHDVLSWASIFHYQDGLLGLEDSDDIVIRTRNGLRFPLGDYFNATLQANFDWDKSPADGAATTD